MQDTGHLSFEPFWLVSRFVTRKPPLQRVRCRVRHLDSAWVVGDLGDHRGAADVADRLRWPSAVSGFGRRGGRRRGWG
jgi:hypothetical protein